MPHKRAKRSMREADRKNRQTDLAPTPLGSEPIPKGMARVLGAERVRNEYRAQLKKKREEGRESKGAGRVELLPNESLREFNRRVEDVHRPLVRTAMKRGKNDEKQKGKRKREAEEEKEEEEKKEKERPVREFATVSSSMPKRLHQVALAPPVLTKGPRGSGVGKPRGKAPAVSMARQVVLEQERERAVEMYRALKASKQTTHA